MLPAHRSGPVEACDTPTRWSCRTGVCHTCTTPLLTGQVQYTTQLLEYPASGEALPCYSIPPPMSFLTCEVTGPRPALPPHGIRPLRVPARQAVERTPPGPFTSAACLRSDPNGVSSRRHLRLGQSVRTRRRHRTPHPR
ncbi:2Fe-2S iron-sulfur cluster-binding protein [Streptomyces sp. BE133]|uniref:2Fe-2S iron-sulfur cluster-binding protein n=1 Tax=Streptomyces sp. BE133 TaxID=3002523 RepID=UPI002E76C73D|nr:2Fe-2S iron-sulfur cluster-binding protein [Streptomyces sp. BE133]